MLEMNCVYNFDCMEGMKQIPDKYFELAIVDPPYGIGAAVGFGRSQRESKTIIRGSWDNQIPDKSYFDELFRVSVNQIIWGGNYFPLPPTRCFVVWDKLNAGRDFADCEMAWTSFDRVARIYQYRVANDSKWRFHPTQKPVYMYQYLLRNYAKEGDKILDTHMGSGSSIIACHDMGFEYMAFEIDEDYYKAAMKRIEEHKAQLRFDLNALQKMYD
jgi:site-specific DNA-methyltransferase (adenine-specific)